MRIGNPLFSQGLAVLIMAAVAMMSWRFCYQPSLRAYQRDRAQAATLTKRLSDIETMLSAEGGQKAWTSHHQRRLTQLKGRFPTPTELPQVLNRLVDVVKSGELRLLNIGQGNLEPLKESGKPVLVEGAPCYRLPITMSTEGRYRAIVTMLEQLSSDTFQGVVSVKQAELSLKKSPGMLLTATLQLDLYLLSADSPAAASAPIAVSTMPSARPPATNE